MIIPQKVKVVKSTVSTYCIIQLLVPDKIAHLDKRGSENSPSVKYPYLTVPLGRGRRLIRCSCISLMSRDARENTL